MTGMYTPPMAFDTTREPRPGRRWFWCLGLIGLVALSLPVWTFLQPRIVQRELALALQVQAGEPGPHWQVEWTRADNDRVNGAWIDLTQADSTRATLALPNYDLSRLALHWLDVPNVEFTLADVRLTTSLLGRVATSEPLGIVDGHEGVFHTTSGDGRIELELPAGLTLKQQAVGVGLVAVCWLLALIVIDLLWFAAAPLSILQGAWVDVAALLAVIAVRVWLAYWSPIMATSDSLEYTLKAECLLGQVDSLPAEQGDFLDYFRLPGYAAILAPFVAALRHFGPAVGVFQALLGVAMAWMVRGMLRPFLRRPWPAIAMLVVGLDPTLLTYERYLLTECVTAFVVTAAAWMVVRLAVRRADSLWWGLRWAGVLGLTCGLGPYVRGNLQLLVLLAPVAVLCTGWRRDRGRAVVEASTALLVSLACIVPWMLRTEHKYGVFGFGLGKAGAAFVNGEYYDITDLNQTAVFAHDGWQRDGGPVATVRKIWALPLVDAAEAPSVPIAQETVVADILEESRRRHPDTQLWGIWNALVAQLDAPPDATAENNWYARRLSGARRKEELDATHTNLTNRHHVDGVWSAIRERVEVDMSHVADSRHAGIFKGLVRGWEYYKVRRLLSLLLIIGTVLALRARCLPVAGVGLIALANALAFAVLLTSAIDRYSAPFYPLVGVVAVFGVYRLAGQPLLITGTAGEFAELSTRQQRGAMLLLALLFAALGVGVRWLRFGALGI